MLGKGLVMFDQFDANGLPTGFMAVGNATKFGAETKDDIAEQYGSINANAALIATALKKRQIKMTIEGTDFKSDVMALALMGGSKTIVSTAAATVTAEQLVSATATHAGRFFYTQKMNIDNTATPPVLTNGVTVLVEGTDYLCVDTESGAFYFPVTTSAVDGSATTITYHTVVGSQDVVAMGTKPQLTGALKFSPDPTDGQKIGLDIWKLNLSPTGTIQFIADEYGNWSMDGLVLDDSVAHPTEPFGHATFLK
jgi:hypothetical protein